MAGFSNINIDLSETFPLLSRAPIVEAVLDIRARGEAPWEIDNLRRQIESRLPEYPSIFPQHLVRREIHFAPLQSKVPLDQSVSDFGFRCESADKQQIVQINQEGFLFSRLEPYISWQHLCKEGLRLWGVFSDITQPKVLHRIGLRFINRITLPFGENRYEDYINFSTASVKGLELPVYEFMGQEVFAVPGYDYAIKFITALQQPGNANLEGYSLILDIDVIASKELEFDEVVLKKKLHEMRWLKNKIFFGSITDKTLNLIR
ncbi:MAG: TIGR04255 family protein [Pseudomonadota bacterium]|mgnify:CR=1 FL=1